MSQSIVIMGVAGCGKSSLAVAVAKSMGLCVIEGDDHHSASSLSKMRGGVALCDADRDGWLGKLSDELRASTEGLVLTCSALKKIYRDRLRMATPGLRFVYLEINREQAIARVTARAASHFFSTSLVDSQFATLESPVGEAGVLGVSASTPISELQAQVINWIEQQENT